MFFFIFFSIIAKGAGGGLGSGGVSSSRGTIISSVIELHKDEEIHILVGQSGENACIRSMGMQDAACSAIFDDGEAKRGGQNIRRVNEMFIEYGGGGIWHELWHLHAFLLKFLMLYFSLSLDSLVLFVLSI